MGPTKDSCLFNGVADLSSNGDRKANNIEHCDRKSRGTHDRWAVCLSEPTVASLRRQAVISTQRQVEKKSTTSMPVTTGSQSLLASLPTFMSVFGEGSGQSNVQIKNNNQPKSFSRQPARAQTTPNQRSTFQPPTSPAELRRASTNTLRTDSTESSPTTTISTVDSSLTEPSPSSSPESPNSLLPLSARSTARSFASDSQSSLMDSPLRISLPPSSTSPRTDRPSSPNKRPRNTKNLSINTSGISTKTPANSSLPGSTFSRKGGASDSSLSNPTAAASCALTRMSSGTTSKDTIQGTGHAFSAPASPSFIVPTIAAPRRSKLGLTITTSDNENSSPGRTVPDTPSRALAPMALRSRASDLSGRLNAVPETPALGPLSRMRDLDSTSGQPLFSPSVAPKGGMQLPPFGNIIDPSLPTPGFGPEGGMQLPPISSSSESSPYGRTSRPALNLPTRSFDSPSSGSVVHHMVEHNPSTPLHDLPLSREAKSPGYPDGPICIYQPSVYLYHQPTREEAREFDVIINVAREVTNPFLAEVVSEVEDSQPKGESRYKDAGVQCTILPGESDSTSSASVPEPPSAVSEQSFNSALEPVSVVDEPETPKASATPGTGKKDPEYIHLPWEHNSKVYDDWLRICELIDDRVKQGKRVLVHCQLGVSRSASLIVAYGMFKNPRLNPDEARELAKKQSRWIDLNMHFMYELGDFKKLLTDKFPAVHSTRRSAMPPGMGLSRTKTDSLLITGNSSMEPMASRDEKPSPIKEESEFGRADQHSPLARKFADARQNDARVPGPSSAPVGTQWSPSSIPEGFRDDKESPYEGAISTPPSRPAPAPPLSESGFKSIDEDRLNGSENGNPVLAAGNPPTLDTSKSLSVPVENQAKHTESLPAPNLTLPSPQPKRSLRPMPSLPAGFNSILPNRSLPRLQPLHTGGFNNLIPPRLDQAIANNEVSSLLSPRALEFTASPFHRTSAGDLAGSSVYERGLMSPSAHERDPRSPPVIGEAPITRNIDDVL